MIKYIAIIFVTVLVSACATFFLMGERRQVEKPVVDDVTIASTTLSVPVPPITAPVIVIKEEVAAPRTSIVMKQTPRGAFLLPDKSASVATLESLIGKVDGIAIISTWKDIEPTMGTYEWGAIDAKIELARKAGKQASLVVFTGKNSLPDWLEGEGVRLWTDGKGNRLVHPTDETFVDLWSKRVALLGARYDSNPTVRMVGICGAAGTLCGPRYPELPSDVSFDGLKASWKRIVSAYETSFPLTSKHLETHLTVNRGTELPEYLFSVSDESVGIFAEFLSDVNPTASSPVPQVISSFGGRWCGFQMVSPLREKLSAAIAHGSSFGCEYFEVYQGDVSKGYLE